MYNCNYDVGVPFVLNQVLRWTKERSSSNQKVNGRKKEHKVFPNTNRMNSDKESKKKKKKRYYHRIAKYRIIVLNLRTRK